MKGKKGFTLIELVIVLILIGIIAAVAVPKFMDLQEEAKKNAVKGALASVRSAINIYYANASIKNKSIKFPKDKTVLQAILNGPMPKNPLNNSNTIDDTLTYDDINKIGPGDGTATLGWGYDKNKGIFWSAVSLGTGANRF